MSEEVSSLALETPLLPQLHRVHITHTNTHYISNSGGCRGKGRGLMLCYICHLIIVIVHFRSTGRNQW